MDVGMKRMSVPSVQMPMTWAYRVDGFARRAHVERPSAMPNHLARLVAPYSRVESGNWSIFLREEVPAEDLVCRQASSFSL